MESCGCEKCLEKLKINSPETEILPSKGMITALKDLLCKLDINEVVPASSPQYDEETLAIVIMQNVSKFKEVSDILEYLKIFSLEPDINRLVSKFIMCMMKDALKDNNSDSPQISDSDENTSDEEKFSDSSEYYDSSSDDIVN